MKIDGKGGIGYELDEEKHGQTRVHKFSPNTGTQVFPKHGYTSFPKTWVHKFSQNMGTQVFPKPRSHLKIICS